MSELQEKLAKKRSKTLLKDLMGSIGVHYHEVTNLNGLPEPVNFSKKLNRQPQIVAAHCDYSQLVSSILERLAEADGSFFLRISSTEFNIIQWIYTECNLKQLLNALEQNLKVCEFQLFSQPCNINFVVLEEEYNYELYYL